jgi:hypothetical protein
MEYNKYGGIIVRKTQKRNKKRISRRGKHRGKYSAKHNKGKRSRRRK